MYYELAKRNQKYIQNLPNRYEKILCPECKEHYLMAFDRQSNIYRRLYDCIRFSSTDICDYCFAKRNLIYNDEHECIVYEIDENNGKFYHILVRHAKGFELTNEEFLFEYNNFFERYFCKQDFLIGV
jgi:hypothetical protein